MMSMPRRFRVESWKHIFESIGGRDLKQLLLRYKACTTFGNMTVNTADYVKRKQSFGGSIYNVPNKHRET